MKRVVIYALVLVLVLISGLYASRLILGNATVVSLKSSSIADPVSKALQDASGGYLPIEGRDYRLSHVEYLAKKQWAVISVKPVSTASDASTIILQQKNGAFQTALGPTNYLKGADLSGLPADVVKYLKHLGLI